MLGPNQRQRAAPPHCPAAPRWQRLALMRCSGGGGGSTQQARTRAEGAPTRSRGNNHFCRCNARPLAGVRHQGTPAPVPIRAGAGGAAPRCVQGLSVKRHPVGPNQVFLQLKRLAALPPTCKLEATPPLCLTCRDASRHACTQRRAPLRLPRLPAQRNRAAAALPLV